MPPVTPVPRDAGRVHAGGREKKIAERTMVFELASVKGEWMGLREGKKIRS